MIHVVQTLSRKCSLSVAFNLKRPPLLFISSGITRNIPTMSFVTKRHDDIIKSHQDSRLYRGLEFANGMKVLLVSDSTTDKSAAALNVGVGHLSDPWELPGLAHFLEHMLFMGTKKYPLENEYSKFLSEHGGGSNAYTASDHTNFYFDVTPEHLEPALDRFAQFFLEPLFTESATDREVNAVDSEHSKNIPSDSWRLSQLERSTSKSSHPYSKFGTGNKDTLDRIPKEKNTNVRTELLKFHEEFYSSNIMGLSILGRESLEALEELALKYFKNVSNKNITRPVWPEHPFGPEQKMTKGYVVPIKDVRSLNITFPLPDQRDSYKSSPTHYIGHLVGHEGPGSLLAELKKRGWVNAILGGHKSGASGFAFFVVNVDLTEEGLEHTDDIVTAVFQYLEMLRKEGPQQAVFEECKKLSNIQFRFKDKEKPQSYVCSIASVLQDYPMKDVLSSDYLLSDWKPDLINETLSYLTPENGRIFLVAKKFEGQVDSKEPYYGIDYKIEKFTPENIEAWKNAGTHSAMTLPHPNEFIPETFDLKPRDEGNTLYPRLISDTPYARLFFKQDDEFLLPKCCMYFNISNPLVYNDPLYVNLTSMFVLLFKDAVNEELYSAEIVGLSYSVKNTKYGLLLTLKGYDDKLQVLCQKVMQRLTTFVVDPVRFEIIKESFVRGLRNFHAEQPHTHVVYYTSLVMSERAWSKDELLECVDDLTVDRLNAFIKMFFDRTHIEGLVHGNMTETEALQVLSTVEDSLKRNCRSKPLLPCQLVKDREIQLEDGCHYVQKATNDIHKSSAIEIYYQCAQEGLHMNVILELFSQIISEPCFNVLRTQEQLGYIVFSGLRRANGVQGVRIIIQSERYPEYLDDRIESFLEFVKGYLANIPDEEFNRHKAALTSKNLERPKRLSVLAARYWSEISSGQYNFSKHIDETEHLKEITKMEIIDFFTVLLGKDSPKRRKLSVYVQSTISDGQVCNTAGNGEQALHRKPVIIEDLAKFKSSKSLYPLPTPCVSLKSHNLSKL